MNEFSVFKDSLNQKGWKMLFLMFFLQIFVALIGRSIAPLGILIEGDLNLTKTQIGMLPAAFFLGQSFISIPSGIITDRMGTKRMFLFVAIFTGLSFGISTFTTQFFILLLLLFFGGAGYGAMQPASNRGIFLWFSNKNRGTAMGIKQTGVTLGSALAAFLLLPLSNYFGWRNVLLIACSLLIIFGLFIAFKYSNPPNEEKDSQSEYNLEQFLLVLKNKALILVSLSAMGLSAGQMILNTYIILYTYEHFGYTLVLSGFLLVISEIAGSFGRVMWGIISDTLFKANRNIVLMIITIITGMLSILFSILPNNTPYWTLVLIVIIFGFCISGFNGIWMNSATETVSKEHVGTASGISLTLGVMGVILGPPVFGFLVDITKAYTVGWLYLSFLMIIVFGLLLLVRRISVRS